MLGKKYKVLIEGTSKRSKEELYGRTTQNVVVIFGKEKYKKGDYVITEIESCTAGTLRGKAIGYA